MQALKYGQSIFTLYVDWEESPSLPSLSSKTNKEPAVVALPLVLHEETIQLNWAKGPMVHLFSHEVDVGCANEL